MRIIVNKVTTGGAGTYQAARDGLAVRRTSACELRLQPPIELLDRRFPRMPFAPGEVVVERSGDSHVTELDQFAALEKRARQLQARGCDALSGDGRLQQQAGVVEHRPADR